MRLALSNYSKLLYVAAIAGTLLFMNSCIKKDPDGGFQFGAKCSSGPHDEPPAQPPATTSTPATPATTPAPGENATLIDN